MAERVQREGDKNRQPVWWEADFWATQGDKSRQVEKIVCLSAFVASALCCTKVAPFLHRDCIPGAGSNNQRQPNTTKSNRTQPVMLIAVLVMWNEGCSQFC